MRVAIARLQSPTSVCLRCRLLPASVPTAGLRTFTSTSRSSAESEPPLTFEQRLKRGIWGTTAVPTSTTSQLPEVENLSKQESAAKQSLDKYVADVDGRGLPVIGIVDKLGKKTGNWKFETFAPREKVTDQAKLAELAYEAVVVAYTNVLYGRDPKNFPEGAGQWARKVKVTKDETTGEVKFDYGSQMVIDGILNGSSTPVDISSEASSTTTVVPDTVDASTSLSDGTPTTDPTPISITSSEDPNLLYGTAWHTLSLSNPALKFAINRRIISSTGHILSDINLNQLATVTDLLSILLTPPRRTEKLDLLSTNPELAELPNVTIYESRLRPLDRERLRGRLSPAEKELLEAKARLERGEVKPEENEEFLYGWEEDKKYPFRNSVKASK